MAITNHTEPAWDDPESSDVNPEQMPATGEVLGHCKIIELIASGGMACVYKAWHEQLEVTRAIKILKPGFTEETKNRLETEAKISANLRHPNIVEIYGFGYWKEIPYIEMEYIDGHSLNDLIEKNGRFPPSAAIAITHFVCLALEFISRQDLTLYGKVYDSLVHRDIKPANILLTSRGNVKLADFGIARPSDVSLHTVGVKVMGTMAYLSPEQLNGEKLDARSDIYSLGVVLYEMIAGAKAFPQDSLPELIQRKTRGQVIPINSLGIKISRPLSNIIDKSLALDTLKRYPDALTFDNDLGNVFKRLSTKSPEETLRSFLKKPPVLHMHLGKKSAIPFSNKMIIIGAAILVVMAGLAILLLHKASSHNSTSMEPAEFSSSISSTLPESSMVTSALPNGEPDTLIAGQEATKEKPEEASRLNFVPDGKGKINHFWSKNKKAVHPSMGASESLPQNVRLMESYLQANNLTAALECGWKNRSSTDGYMQFLRGKAYYRTGYFQKALEALELAQTTPSKVHPNLQRDAVYLWAETREAIYKKIPNRDNRVACKKGYQSFLEAYCTSGRGSSQCAVARGKIVDMGD